MMMVLVVSCFLCLVDIYYVVIHFIKTFKTSKFW